MYFTNKTQIQRHQHHLRELSYKKYLLQLQRHDSTEKHKRTINHDDYRRFLLTKIARLEHHLGF